MARSSIRGNYEGTVFYRESRKSWVAQITLGYDPKTGQRKRPVRYAKTKKEALEKLKELQEKYAHKIHFDADKITVREWLNKWLETYKVPKLRENTQVSYRRIIDICNEAIGYMKLEKVQPSDLQNVIYNVIGKEHYRSCQYFRTVIKQAFARAVKERLIITSPADDLELPAKPDKKPFYKPTPEVWKTLIEAEVAHYGWKMIILTVMVTGMRRSEILALTWDSFNIVKEKNVIKGGTVTINKAIGIGDVDPKTGRRRIYIDQTKSSSGVRTLPIPADYIQELLAYKKHQNKLRLKAKTWEHPEMVFTTYDGRYYNPDVFSSLYSSVCKRYDIKTTFHMLRHDFASSMNSSHEFNFKDIQHQLGHSNIQITLDTYTHLEEKDMEKVDNWVDGRFKKLVGKGTANDSQKTATGK
ncbi:phage integrase family protein [Anaerovibrio sp. JC8]|uniref:site-specific integrase n=1 Tax=Anaerovibrio sp. JC8 TaxID=1240085 RepID=UPI000A0A9658|nr:tyrosine-type recombinase/integrase [Anaerovibrio sp. JC8]ORT99431.1 phage integrase family protein [Anaerovibrio sp. JC8]